MKAIFSLVAVLFMTSINAQKLDCSAKVGEYQESFKAKDISAAFTVWSEVRKNCPKQSETIYTDGLEILQYKIDNAANAEEKEALVRDVMKLYDQFNKNYPVAVPDFEVKKAMALYNNKIDAKEEIFNLLSSGFSKAANNVTDATAIYTYYSLCYEKYKTGDTKFSFDFILNKYILVNGLLSDLEVSNPAKTTEYKTALRSITALSKEVLNCDNLSKYFEKNYEPNKDNTAWLEKALSTMTVRCSGQAIFNTMAEKLYAAKATSKSAYYMALAKLKLRKFEDSVKFYNEAAELETNPTEKAKIYYTLGTGLLANDSAKSKENLNKALQFDPKMGRAYLFLAQLYSYAPEKGCGKDEFEKKAIYYLAAQTALKAGEADPVLKPAATKTAEDLKAKALKQSEINTAKMAGKSLTIGCWINETITFPAK